MNQRSRRATAILGRATIAWSMAMLPGLAWAATPPSKTFDPAAATWSSSDASDLQIADNKSQPLVPPRQTQGQHGTGQPAQNHHVQPAQPKYVQQQHSVQPAQPKYVQQQHSVQPTKPKYVQQQHSVQPTQPKYVQQQHSVQPAQRHYVTQQSKGPQYWTHQTQRYDWQAYRQGQRPPQWQQYHRNFDPRPYQHNWYAQQRYHGQAYRQPVGWYYRRWSYGQVFPVAFWVPNYWLTDYSDFGLPNPPYGYVWVRYSSDAILVNVGTGMILTVVYGVFYST